MIILVICIVSALLCAGVANTKGRSGVLWLFLGFFLPPIAMPIVLMVQPPKNFTGPRDKVVGRKICPDCGEWVQARANICRHCRHDFRKDAPAS